jgi:molecular chaperone GrpE
LRAVAKGVEFLAVTDQQETELEATTTDTQNPQNGADGATPTAQVSLESITRERDELLDQLKRSVAEFANYRRRIDQERELIREIASKGLLTQMLPVLDDLQRAVASIPSENAEQPWVQGVRNIERKLAGLVERAGVVPIDAIGQSFDPAFHEAVATEPGSSGNFVVEVYQTGYKLGQELLRPAMVKVGDRQAEKLDA